MPLVQLNLVYLSVSTAGLELAMKPWESYTLIQNVIPRLVFLKIKEWDEEHRLVSIKQNNLVMVPVLEKVLFLRVRCSSPGLLFSSSKRQVIIQNVLFDKIFHQLQAFHIKKDSEESASANDLVDFDYQVGICRVGIPLVYQSLDSLDAEYLLEFIDRQKLFVHFHAF